MAIEKKYCLADELKASFRKYGFTPNKALGQNFLIDREVIEREVGLAEIAAGEIVLEIGPGFGFLTRKLLEAADRVVAIEKDDKLAGILRSEIRDNRLSVITGDAVSGADFPPFDRCVANIPYEISSKVVLKLGKCRKPSLLILQKEFAERMVAHAGSRNYSRISVASNYYFKPKIAGRVLRHSFFPVPKVDSAIVVLAPRTDAEKKKLGVKDEEFFFRVVSALFQHKNQKAKKALIHARAEFGLDKLRAKELSEKIPYSDKKVDFLDIPELAEIACRFKKLLE